MELKQLPETHRNDKSTKIVVFPSHSPLETIASNAPQLSPKEFHGPSFSKFFYEA